jgi:hypothetical protein
VPVPRLLSARRSPPPFDPVRIDIVTSLTALVRCGGRQVHTRNPARSDSPSFRPVSEPLDEDDRAELEPPDEELDDDELEEPGVDELLDEEDDELVVEELLDAVEELDDDDVILGATGLLPHAPSAAAAASDAPPDSSCRKRRRFCRSLS